MSADTHCQVSDGNPTNGVARAAIDKIIGQAEEAFKMPFLDAMLMEILL